MDLPQSILGAIREILGFLPAFATPRSFRGNGRSGEFFLEQRQQDVLDQRGFSRAADTRHANQLAQGKAKTLVAQIVSVTHMNRQSGIFPSANASPPAADPRPPGEISAGERVRMPHQFGPISLKNDVASRFATTWAKIDEMIGGAHHFGLVLDHHHGVARIAEPSQDAHQPGGVPRMQPHTGLVQHEE